MKRISIESGCKHQHCRKNKEIADGDQDKECHSLHLSVTSTISRKVSIDEIAN